MRVCIVEQVTQRKMREVQRQEETEKIRVREIVAVGMTRGLYRTRYTQKEI